MKIEVYASTRDLAEAIFKLDPEAFYLTTKDSDDDDIITDIAEFLETRREDLDALDMSFYKEDWKDKVLNFFLEKRRVKIISYGTLS